jgi:L-lactate utilization protein LutC
MNLFKKLFNTKKETSELDYLEPSNDISNLSLDDIFVHNFIKKGGKFLYCSHQEEVNQNLLNIIDENNWEDILCFNDDLNKIITIIGKNGDSSIKSDHPFFTPCEHLISENGSVLFSSNQVCQHKIADLPNHFIVFAKTSQLVRTTSEGLMGIRKNYKKDFPTNISSIKSYMPNRVNDDFLSYGNTNAKSLYLLLLEDL